MSSASKPSSTPTTVLGALNNAQRQAVSSSAATVAILAGPGSGKTHTLTSRIAWLIDRQGHRPQDVVVATFTVKAAREMQRRVGKALGGGRERQIVLGTFHSIARRYLAAYGQQIGLDPKFAIADDSDSKGIVKRVCKRLGLACDPMVARGWISKQKAKGMQADVGPKRKPTDGMTAVRDLEMCYKEYQNQLERSNLLDYDDLLVKCVELLRRSPSCVSNVQAVLIDEYQDTNGVQYELMKLLAQKRGRITIVGDPDQSIYGWRSAEIRNLHRLLKEYPGTAEISLEENYRSSQMILRTSLEIIQQDKSRYQKALRPVHTKGTVPVLRKLRTPAVEAEWIVSEIKRVMMMSGDMMNHDDVAILVRSASLSRNLETALGKAGIAYKMVGVFKFFDRTEIKVMLDYLCVIHQPENNDAFARIINVPKRGVGEATIKSLLEEAERSSTSLFALLNKHCRGEGSTKTKITKQAELKISGQLLRLLNSIRRKLEQIAEGTPYGLVEMIQEVVVRLNFQRFLKDTHPDDHEQRWLNVQEFFNMATDFVRDMEASEDGLPEIDGIKQRKDVDVLPRFLANIRLAAEMQAGQDDGDIKPQVTISTIHAAKGLEWPVVFVPGVYNGCIPHARSEDGNEERRLLYVAMTRAQGLLCLSYPAFGHAGTDGQRNEPSSFVADVQHSFARRGPDLHRPVMEQMARILGRAMPPHNIYDALPATFCVEDTLFPEDPDENQERATGDGNKRPAKRPRRFGPVAVGTGDETPWSKEYATTMEQASNFTVSSLPGFVSAGSHQAAIASAVAANKGAQKGLKRSVSSGAKPGNQPSIIGFVRSNSASVQAVAGPGKTVRVKNPPAVPAVPAVPFIDAAYRQHKLQRKQAPRRMPFETEEDASSYRKQHPCFSSSPPRPDDQQDGRKPVSAEHGERSGEVDLGPPPEPTRPAACMHETTCNMPLGAGGDLKRPVAMSRGGIAPMERLRKPFKPLTLNRL